ncbi:hypothetical protein YC2023_107437 [Brassica napus]
MYKKVAPLKTLLSTTTNIKVKMHVEEKTDKLGTQNIEICNAKGVEGKNANFDSNNLNCVKYDPNN